MTIKKDENRIKLLSEKLLQTANISKIYFIDDAFIQSPEISIEEIIAEYRILVKKDEEKALDLLSLPTNPGIENLVNELESTWNNRDPDQKIELANDLGISNDISDTTIKSIFPDSNLIEEIPPVDWDKIKNTVWSSANNQSRVICLFDKDLSASPSYSDEGGINLLQEVLDADNEYIYCGILTASIITVNDEFTSQDRFREELDSNSFLALSKSRRDDDEKMFDGIKKLVLNNYLNRTKIKGMEIINLAFKNAESKFNTVDIFSLERMVFKSARKENGIEFNILTRLHNIIYRNELNKLIMDERMMGEISDSITKSRPISEIESENFQPEYEYPQVRKLREIELFDSKEYLRYKPISIGDIFLIEKSGVRKEYMLLDQPCDLEIRTNGERSNNYPTLIPILMENRKANKNFKDRGVWLNYWSSKSIIEGYSTNKKKIAVLQFKNTIVIDARVLDLSYLSKNGECVINTKNMEDIPKYYSKGLLKHQKLLREYFIEMNENFMSVKHKERDEIFQRVVAPIKPNPDIEIIRSTKSMAFNISRLKRYKTKYAEQLLIEYTAFQSRGAKSIDFSN